MNLESKHKTFIITLAIIIIALLVTILTNGVLYTILLSLVIISILFITKSLWLPESYGKTRVRILSLIIISSVALSPVYWPSLIGSILPSLLSIINKLFKTNLTITLPEDKPTIEILIFTLIGIFIVNFFGRDNTAMKQHSIPIDSEFPDKQFKDRLTAVSRIIKNDIDKINTETNWHEEFFTPLDAEVEIKSDNKLRKKITDLLTAIKKDKDSKVFLVLGDPGSGKSVSLRKLCSDLLNEVPKTGKIPIYISLREWDLVGQRWSKLNPPTVAQLQSFIISNLKNKGDVFFSDFIDTYFNRMVDHGRIFFLLDSFDEIPSVMDVDESDWLIDELSSVIFTFLAGAQESRGILASRIFRKPTRKFNARTILEIRPFSERKILERFEKSIGYDQRIEKLVFKEKQEYGILATNPFIASLILSYAKKHEFKLPNNQVELFESYIDERLDLAKKQLAQAGLTKDQAIAGMMEIAFFMFSNPDYGLEAPEENLITELPSHKTREILGTLVFCRLGRIGSGSGKLFSFVHRRFSEFLVAKELILNPELVLMESIPNDSRWRDSLVLYCELADDNEAIKLARYCWGVIKAAEEKKLTLNDLGYLGAVHSLRFLSDAFRNRRTVLSEFKDDLAAYIINQINVKKILETKLTIESVCLIEPQQCEVAIFKALDIGNNWINENAIRSCRHLSNISIGLEKKICDYIDRMDELEFVKKYKDLSFSLTLSDGFKGVITHLNFKRLDFFLFGLGLIILLMMSPIIAMTFISLFLAVRGLTQFISTSLTGSISLERLEINRDLKKNRTIGKFLHSSTSLLYNSFPTRLLFLFRFQCSIVALLLLVLKKEIPNNSIFNFNSEVYLLLVLGSCLLTFPWFDLGRLAGRLRIRYKTFLRVLLPLALTLFSSYFVFLFIERFKNFFEKLTIFVLIFAGLGIFYAIFTSFINRYNDLSKLKKTKVFDGMSRKIIQRTLDDLKTSHAREIYVLRIKEEKITKVKGTWNGSELPNYSDHASTILAQLEEVWLGFDR